MTKPTLGTYHQSNLVYNQTNLTYNQSNINYHQTNLKLKQTLNLTKILSINQTNT